MAFPGRTVPVVKFVQEQVTITWLWEDLLPDVGWTLLVGMKGLGKSTFAAQLCQAFSAGTDFLGKKTVQCNCLYVQADSPTTEWREMLKRIAPTGTWFTMVDVPQKCLGNPDYIGALYNLVQKVKPQFIVFDSLYNLTDQPINTERVLLPLSHMSAIAQGAPWLLIHHPPHDESRAAGHHSIAANCSNEWILLRNKLKIDKGRLVKQRELSLTRDDAGLWVLREDTPLRHQGSSMLDGLLR